MIKNRRKTLPDAPAHMAETAPSNQQEIWAWFEWCGREDSNFHGLPHSDLNAARLPIPPRPHVVEADLLGSAHVANRISGNKPNVSTKRGGDVSFSGAVGATLELGAEPVHIMRYHEAR
jgi:hypothetical protein